MFSIFADGSATRTELIAAIGALGTVVAFLWKSLATKHEATEKLYLNKWEECEKGHEKTRSEYVELAQKVGGLEGRIAVMSDLVLKEVHGHSETNDSGGGESDDAQTV